MNPDQKYGAFELPNGPVSEVEKNHRPDVHILDPQTAPALLAYMNLVSARIPLQSRAVASMKILWVVENKEEVLFALEEVVDVASGELLYCLQSGAGTVPVGTGKLGHPSLLSRGNIEKRARIGGEIIFDADWPTGSSWVLTNASGRYGRRPTTQQAHLQAVSRIFTHHGIHLAVGKVVQGLRR